ncbi:MAG: hypothetical protein IPM38_00390 [Ignavibacteria bacterium]|nr:hypothetical protein [Ignavibacteria bacterium]
MNTKINDILEDFDNLSLNEQEELIEIEKKRLIENKRKLLVDEVKEAEKEYTEGKYITGETDELMRAIDYKNTSDK